LYSFMQFYELTSSKCSSAFFVQVLLLAVSFLKIVRSITHTKNVLLRRFLSVSVS